MVSLSFPDNDVSQVVADVRSLTASGATDPAVTSEVATAVAPLVEALRSLGGTSSQAAAGSTVRCAAEVAPADRPAAKADKADKASDASENGVRR